jgi:hypothetical protein
MYGPFLKELTLDGCSLSLALFSSLLMYIATNKNPESFPNGIFFFLNFSPKIRLWIVFSYDGFSSNPAVPEMNEYYPPRE